MTSPPTTECPSRLVVTSPNSPEHSLTQCEPFLFSLLFSLPLFFSLSLCEPSSAPAFSTTPPAAANSVIPTLAPVMTSFQGPLMKVYAHAGSVTPGGPAHVPIAPTSALCVKAPRSYLPPLANKHRARSLATMRGAILPRMVTDFFLVVSGQLFPKGAWRRAHVASCHGGWTVN